MYSLNGIPFKKNRTDERKNGHSDKRTDGRTVRLNYAPNFIWGYKKHQQVYLQIVFSSPIKLFLAKYRHFYRFVGAISIDRLYVLLQRSPPVTITKRHDL